MNVFERMDQWLDKLSMRGMNYTARDPAMLEYFGGAPNAYGISVTPETAMRVAVVYGCVRILSEAIASTPLYLYQRRGDDKERATDHPLYKLAHKRPNRYQSPFEFRDQMQTSLGLRGVAYAEILVSPKGEHSLIPMSPDRVEAKLLDDYSVAYRYFDKGRSRILLEDEVLAIRYMVSDGVTPVSPIKQQRDTVAAAIAEQRYTANFFKNGGRPSGWLQHPSVFKDDEMRKKFRARFSEQFTNDNQGAAPLLEDGVTYNPISVSNDDAQLLELKKFSIAEIARIYRIPLILLSETEKSTSWGSGIEQFMLAFVTHTLRPWLVRWEQAFSRCLLTDAEQDEYFFEFNIDALLRSDLLTRYRAYEIGRRNHWLSANEVRARENLNRVESGDQYDDVQVNGSPASDKPKEPEEKPDE